MPIPVTCIGAYPKPDFVKLPDWFNLPADKTDQPTRGWRRAFTAMGDNAETILARGTAQVIREQVDAGVDIPTDGELARENYVHYHCRHLCGFDFDCLTKKSARGGSYATALPTIRGPVSAAGAFLTADWRRAQRCTDKPVKMTIPGPMTIADTTYDDYYYDAKKLGVDLAAALNNEVRALADAGCKYIQIDEPVFARMPAAALEYGIENLERAFHNCPKSVTRIVHICCGYPDKLNATDYPKAERKSYFDLADALDGSSVQWISIEDAHRHNDAELFARFANRTLVLGAVDVATSRVESVDEIRARLETVLNYIDRDRLVAAPDCGLGLLTAELARAKLKNLCRAARSV